MTSAARRGAWSASSPPCSPTCGGTAVDPNVGAVAWAQENLPGIGFFVSPQEPPLPVDVGALDFAFAVSIWSHYSEAAALRWFAEMERVIRPGGALVLTAHGYQTLECYGRLALRPWPWLAAAHAALYSRGHFFYDDFGPEGDWGVASPDWGISLFSLEWLTSRLCPPWRLAHFAPGRGYSNQDLIVLQRGR